jgi:hypothetical protein
MQSNRVSMRFSRFSDSRLNFFAPSILLGMTNNIAYLNPLVPLDELSALATTFGNDLIASNLGGKISTAKKNTSRAALLSALRSQANYVQGVAKHDLLQLLSSGFTAVSRNRAQSLLATPRIRKILNEMPEQLALRVTPVANARNYQLQMQGVNGEWLEAGIFSQARLLRVKNLTPGVLYNFRVRALGGSMGFSNWSGVMSWRSL